MHPQYTPSDVARFWSKVDRRGPDECWEWQAGKFPYGYGAFQLWPRQTYAHRFSYELVNGPIPDGLLICHSCDNPPCVNPAHLWLGTYADNRADCDAKGRQASGDRNGACTHPERRPTGDRNGHYLHPESTPRGESHRSSKLTAAIVREMRALHATGKYSFQQLSTRFGVTAATTYRAVARKSWASVA